MGAYLRSVRRRRRIGIERAAEETRIRSDFLMRMESDEFDFLAPTYVRGFLKTYARYLRVDPTPLLDEFDSRFGVARAEVQQIGALERHGRRHAAMPRRKMNSWTVAAVIAASVLVTLGVIGVIAGGDESQPANEVAGVPTPTDTPTPLVSESPSPEPLEDSLAEVEGVTVEVIAVSGDCWVFATEDGKEATPTGGQVLVQGETLSLDGNTKVFLRLGAPSSVELIVNGTNIGSPGGDEPVNLTFPDDLPTL
jgi:cytoskeleton protein RodZ